MTVVTAEQARNTFSDIISKTAFTKERTIVTRNGKKMAAIISIDDLELLEETFDRIEDSIDAKDISDAFKEFEEGKTIPLEEVKRHLKFKNP